LVENSLSTKQKSDTQADKFEEFFRISLKIGCIGHLKFSFKFSKGSFLHLKKKEKCFDPEKLALAL